MEKSGQTLNRAYGVFGLLAGAYTNEEIQRIEEEEAPKLAAHSDAIFMNDKLFQRVKTIYENRENSGLDAESKKLAEYYYQKFELAGANLSPEAKEKMKELNAEEATLNTKFTNIIVITSYSIHYTKLYDHVFSRYSCCLSFLGSGCNFAVR